jgi:hypothetical protein
MTSDNRLTWGLIIDVLDVLERHGYHKHDNQHTGQAVGVIHDLARVYEGTGGAPSGTYLDQAPPSPHPEPGRPVRQADPDAVILADGDASTVLAALDVAADYKRDRAEMCADCADQSCPTCQAHLQDARAYDHLAAQILQTAQARPARRDQPEPGSASFSPGQADPAAGIEAGQ